MIATLALCALAVAPEQAQRRRRPPQPETAPPAPQEKKPEETKEEEPETFLAIVGGDVYTIGAGTIRRGTVLCRAKKIWKVGTEVVVPEGAVVIDAKGMRVYPGLVAASSTGILGGFGGGSPADSVDPFGLSLELASASGITTAFSSHAVAKVIPGELEGIVLRESASVALAYSASNPTARIETREKFAKAREHLRKVRDWEEAKKKDPKAPEPAKSGVDENTLKLLRRELPARVLAGAADDLLALCLLLDEFPFDAVVEGAYEAWTVAEELGRRGIRCVINPRAKVRARRDTARPTGSSIENAAILRRAGVPFAVVPPGTSISTGGIAGRDLMTLPLDAAFAMRGGLDEEAALESVTIEAARVLGVADRVGSIDPGKDADLIVTSGDLLDYRTFVEYTVVNGKVVYDKQKTTFFSHIRPRPAAPLEPVEAETKPASEEPGGDGGGSVRSR